MSHYDSTEAECGQVLARLFRSFSSLETNQLGTHSNDSGMKQWHGRPE